MTSMMPLMHLDDSVYNRNVASFYVEHHYLSDADRIVSEIEEQDVATIEGGFHAAAEDHHHRRFAPSDQHQGSPDDQCGGHDET
eukprot:CAMPEP_0118922590 /NCGR_PEP_ID=MMETSP1169-20130426/1468_1 /TAXON_ID=36882 /ORGANISM="Pyramimonas obovata, Strain CCMP722" /LENGTH=83 /DNA_ID=CAMNT_0006863489 /DNA_START=479 /DNA_END=730 /DNA_ORIENTATION=-